MHAHMIKERHCLIKFDLRPKFDTATKVCKQMGNCDEQMNC